MIRRCAFVLAVACAIVAALSRELAAAPATPPVEIRGIAVGFAGNYKLGVWTPVEVELRGGTEPISGRIELTLPDGDGVLSRVASDPARLIQVLPGRTVKAILYARFGQSQGTLEVRFVVGGKPLAERSYQTGLEIDAGHILYPMDSAAELIVSVGPSIGISSSIGMIADTNEPARRVAKLADAGSLPTRWFGYEGVDRVVIATSQPDVLDPITTTSARSEALYEWVRLGGRVVMCVGREGSALFGKDTPLARLAPGKFDRMETLRRVTPLESYAEASTPLATSRRQLQLDVPRLDDVRGAIVAYEGAQAEALPLVIRSAVGFGHVVFVAVDLDQPPFVAWTSRSQLVDKLLDRPAARTAAGGTQAAGQVASLGYQDIAGQLRAALDNFLGVSLIPFWAVVLLVVGYIVLIGPFDFWLVKKVFRRMEATWITFPLWVILVSVGAYAAAYALKGRDLRSNQAELVDVDLESQLVRGTAWINLLSPRPDSYDISYRAKPPGDMQLAAPPEHLVAWFGLPGGALGAMNAGGGQTSLFQRPYLFSTQLDAMLGVPIQVWSTKSLTARWHGSGESLLEAELNETVDQMLSGTITNRLGMDLADARLLYDRWAYPIPRLAAGAQLKISDELRPLTSRTLYTQASIQGKEELINRYDAASTDVPWILERMLVHEAIGGSGYTAGLSNRFQQFCDLSQHLKEGKAVLIVRAPAGGSELLLGNQPVGGQHDQRWTIYRFVIPVHKARAQ